MSHCPRHRYGNETWDELSIWSDEWGERIGFKQVYAVLDALHTDLGEERYRICPLLKEIAVTGKFWG